MQFLDYLQGPLLLVLRPPRGVPRWWWDSWKTLHGILLCKYIHIARKKKKRAGKLCAAGEVQRHPQLPAITGTASSSPVLTRKEDGFSRFPWELPNAWAPQCVISQHDRCRSGVTAYKSPCEYINVCNGPEERARQEKYRVGNCRQFTSVDLFSN